MVEVTKLFDLTKTRAKDFFWDFNYEDMKNLKAYIVELGESLDKNEFYEVMPKVWVHKSASLAKSASLYAPCIIDAESEIRHCAFLRGATLVGKKCVVGNSSELKNCILFDETQVPHFNYVGDSILGYRAHFGAGVITANLKSTRKYVFVQEDDYKTFTGLRKFGSLVGDKVEVGCNSVLNPGTIVGRNTTIYPLSNVRGVIPANSILKHNGKIIEKD